MVRVIKYISRGQLGQRMSKRLSTQLFKYNMNNYNNSDDVIKFGVVDMSPLYIIQRRIMETSKVFIILRSPIEHES